MIIELKQIKTYSIIFICTVLLFNCKKYPEGGCERRGPKNIIGVWKLSLYEVNGIDSTELINYMGDETYKKVSIFKNVSTVSVSYEGFNSNSGHFEDNNTRIVFNSVESGRKCVQFNGVNYCYRSFLTPEIKRTKWEIVKLTAKEFVFKNTGSAEYVIKLIK